MVKFERFYRYQTEQELRMAYCLRLLGMLGAKEGSATHQKLVDDYNSLKLSKVGLPRNTPAVLSYDWCAITVAGQAHAMGMTEIYPMEMSCSKIIQIAKNMGIWIEDDNFLPSRGDWCIFAWEAPEGENTEAPDHIGTVYSNDGENICTVEGNKGDAVGVRMFKVGDKRIRGYVHPDFTPLIGTLIAPPAAKEEPSVPPVELHTVYRRTDEVPEWARATVAKLMERGWLMGEGEEDLALSYDLLRMLVINDRAGLYDN